MSTFEMIKEYFKFTNTNKTICRKVYFLFYSFEGFKPKKKKELFNQLD